MPSENVFQDGPYLTAALLCERVLDEKDGVKSAIRIVSQITKRLHGVDVPEKMPQIDARLSLLISMKTGKKAGKHKITITCIRPDNTTLPTMTQSINLEQPENRGSDLLVALDLSLDQEGIYWFDVYFDNYRMTKIPLSVRYITHTAGQNQTQPAVQ